MSTPADSFSTETLGLPEANSPASLDFTDGDRFDLRVAPVAKKIGDATVRMLTYDGSIPGPTLRVKQGSELMVNVANAGDIEATVHWHGLRLDNRYDGTHETQSPIPTGGEFTYRIQWSGRTRCSCRPDRLSTSCSKLPTRAVDGPLPHC